MRCALDIGNGVVECAGAMRAGRGQVVRLPCATCYQACLVATCSAQSNQSAILVLAASTWPFFCSLLIVCCAVPCATLLQRKRLHACKRASGSRSNRHQHIIKRTGLQTCSKLTLYRCPAAGARRRAVCLQPLRQAHAAVVVPTAQHMWPHQQHLADATLQVRNADLAHILAAAAWRPLLLLLYARAATSYCWGGCCCIWCSY